MPINNSKPLSSQKKSLPKSDSFLEQMRSISSGTMSSAKNDLFKPGVKDIFDSLSPFGSFDNAENSQNSPDNYSKIDQYSERKFGQQKRQMEIARREERIVFTRKERENQMQVKSLQEEIKKLAVSTGELAREVQVATMQEEATPGTYHINFFQRLLMIVKNLRSQVQESSLWLSSWNKKSKKKNGYWNQFKKSGSSFSLHHDRAVATQAG